MGFHESMTPLNPRQDATLHKLPYLEPVRVLEAEGLGCRVQGSRFRVQCFGELGPPIWGMAGVIYNPGPLNRRL